MNFGGSGCPNGSCEPGFTPSSRELAHEPVQIATKSDIYIMIPMCFSRAQLGLEAEKNILFIY